MTPTRRPRILLVNPPIRDFTAYDFWLKPYGILQVGGYLRGRADLALFDYLDRLHPAMAEGGRPVKSDRWGRGPFRAEPIPKPIPLADIRRRYRRFGLPRRLFGEFLDARGPFDAALVQTVMTYWYPGVREVIEDLRAHVPKTRIVLGGIYATLCPDHARSLGADLLILGMNLAPLWEFLGAEPDFDQPPFWEGYPSLRTGVLKASDGCPFRCTYCSVPQVYGRFAPRPPARCARELEALRARGVTDIAWYDEALLCRPEATVEKVLRAAAAPGSRANLDSIEKRPCLAGACVSGEAGGSTSTGAKSIPPKGNDPSCGGIHFHSPNGLHARLVTPPVARLLVDSGFRTFFLGLESADESWHRHTGGKVTPNDVAVAVENLLQAGAGRECITAYVIAGHPDSNAQDVESALRFAHGLGIRVMLSEFAPVPGTPDAERCRRVADLDEPLNHNKTAFAIRMLGGDRLDALKRLCRYLNGRRDA